VSSLEGLASEYVAGKRALGFTLDRTERLLAQFCQYLRQENITVITVPVMLAWATSPHRSTHWHSDRLSVLRVFARWANVFDSGIPIPPTSLLPYRRNRSTAFIYSDAEVAALLGAADRIRSAMVADTYRSLISLLWCTGMRVGEAIALDRTDLVEGVLTVRGAKFGKTRLVPVHPTVVDALTAYGARRDAVLGEIDTGALFASIAGTRLIYKNVHFHFHRLIISAGITARSPGCRPRIHDLRHSFAVTTMLTAYRDGAVPAEVLPVLSTYLGHVSTASTYWYLQAEPVLLAEAARWLAPMDSGSEVGQ
jgi:integrase/recombinase XerD